jgi:hypothetical protein
MALKLRKEKIARKRKEDALFMKMWRMKRDKMHALGVTARRDEKQRIKELKEWIKSRIRWILLHLCFVNPFLIRRLHERQQIRDGLPKKFKKLQKNMMIRRRNQLLWWERKRTVMRKIRT